MHGQRQTPWKLRGRLGEVYGGRVHPRWSHVIDQVHSLDPPGEQEEQPICITDNPSRDFVFPITAGEAVARLRQLPEGHVRGLTHVWLRRIRKRDYEQGDLPFACLVCGGDVEVIMLYPWPADLLLRFPGRRKPTARQLREFQPWSTDLVRREGEWCLKWTLKALRRFYLDDLLLHEVGHHLDRSRPRSITARKRREDFAVSYAVFWSQRINAVYEHPTR